VSGFPRGGSGGGGSLLGDVAGPASANLLQPTANVESVLRASSIDELIAPAAAVDWNGQRLENLSVAQALTDAARADTMGLLLAYVSYFPAGLTIESTASTMAVAVDSTNLTVSFVAPPSGDVLVRVTALMRQSATFGGLCMLTHGTTTVIGPRISTGVGLPNAYAPVQVVIPVTGLVAGTTYDWDLGYYVNNSVTSGSFFIVEGENANNNFTGLPVTIEVLAG
jgi:hypothetical protein